MSTLSQIKDMKGIKALTIYILCLATACSWAPEPDACRDVGGNTSGIYENITGRTTHDVCGFVVNHFNTQPLFSADLQTAIGHNYMFVNLRLFDHRQLFVLLTANDTDYMSSAFDLTFDLTEGSVHNAQLIDYQAGNFIMRFGRNFNSGFDYANLHVIKSAGSSKIKGRFSARGTNSGNVIETDFTYDMNITDEWE